MSSRLYLHIIFKRITQRIHNSIVFFFYELNIQKWGQEMKRKLLSVILVSACLLSACGTSGQNVGADTAAAGARPSQAGKATNGLSSQASVAKDTLLQSGSEAEGDDYVSLKAPATLASSSKPLTISVGFDWMTRDLETAAKLFKQTHPGADIIIKSSGGDAATFDNDSGKYVTQTVTSLMAGKADDIFDGTEIPYVKLADSGLLAGFYPLMDADKNFRKADYYTNVFDAMSYKGQLYMFPLDIWYTLTGINNTAAPDVIKKYSQLTTISDAERVSFYKANGNTKSLSLCERFDPLFVITRNFDQFINYEKKTCDFKNNNFIQLVTDLKNLMGKNTASNNVSYGIDLKKDAYDSQKYLFQDGYTDFYLLKYKEFSGFRHFIPLATPDGKVYIYPVTKFCISEQSANKELAWEFIKFLTLPETNNQIKTLHSNINKASFKEAEIASLKKSVEDNKSQFGIYPVGDVQQTIRDVAAYYDKINQMPMRYVSLENYTDILTKDTGLLNKGAMTPEQMASDLQNKISLSLNE